VLGTNITGSRVNPIEHRPAGISRSVVCLCLSLALLASPRRARADLDDRDFVGSFLGNDAEADNFFGVEVVSDQLTTGAEFFLEKTLSKRSSVGLTWGLQQLSAPGRQSAFGTDNLSIFYKYVFLTLQHHELAVAVSPSVEVTTGNRRVGADNHNRVGGDLLFAKGLGDLPESLRHFRPLAIEGEFGFDHPVDGFSNQSAFGFLELEYSLSYFNKTVRARRPFWSMHDLVSHVELDYDQLLNSRRGGTAPDFRVTPGLTFVSPRFVVKAGVMIAVNGAAPSGDRLAFVGLIGFPLDALIPALGRNLF
jgi:hypothetical protein